MKNKFLKIFFFSLFIIAQSCSKIDDAPNSTNDNNGGLGLTFALSSETANVPWTPDFIVSSLPNSVSLNMPPVGNQGRQNSCVAWATAYAGMSYFMHRNTGSNYNSNRELASVKYVYNQISNGACSGTSFPQNFNVLLNKGVCTVADMPYNDFECSTQPNSVQNLSAVNNKIFAWKKVDKNKINQIKSCLAAEHPVFIGVMIDESFDKLSAPYIWTRKFGSARGGHALTVVGYDDNKGAFKVQNSWGPYWKDKGCLWISYSFFSTAVAGNECYITFPQINDPSDDVNKGLILNMPFNGNANDYSGNNNNGIVTGVTLTSDHKGVQNSAYKFSGLASPSYIRIPSSIILNNLTDFSISIWYRPDSYSGDDGYGNNNIADGNSKKSWQTIMYKGKSSYSSVGSISAFRILLGSERNEFSLYNGSGGGGIVSPLYSHIGEWHNVIITKKGTVLKFYFDGALLWDREVDYTNFGDVKGDDIFLGKSLYPGNGVPFNGAIGDFRIYNRAITGSEAQKLFKL